ncbi:MAG: AI-2E family transporter [Syntrophobacteria bacterium]
MESNSLAEKNRARKLFLLALLFSFLYLAFLLLRPYLGTIIFAAVLSSVFHPLHRRLAQRCRGRENLAAFVTSLLLVLIVVVPLISFSLAMVRQGVESLRRISAWVQAGNLQTLLSSEHLQPLKRILDHYLALPTLEQVNVQKALADASSKFGHLILSHGTEVLGNATALVIRSFLLILLIFYLLRDGQAIVARLRQLSPLAREQEQKLIERIRTLSSSVVLGNAATAAAQGIAGGIGLWICGIPALFWGTIMAFTSLIPTVGTALVWVPAVGYLFAVGSWGKAVFLCVWCVVLVGSIDNFLRPFLMKGQGDVSSIYLFFAILGGVHVFGIAGILYGPLIFGVSAVLIYLYELEYSGVLEK